MEDSKKQVPEQAAERPAPEGTGKVQAPAHRRRFGRKGAAPASQKPAATPAADRATEDKKPTLTPEEMRAYYHPKKPSLSTARDAKSERMIYDILAKFDQEAANPAPEGQREAPQSKPAQSKPAQSKPTQGKPAPAAPKAEPKTKAPAPTRTAKSAAEPARGSKSPAAGERAQGDGRAVKAQPHAAHTAPMKKTSEGSAKGALPVPAGVRRAKVVKPASAPAPVRTQTDGSKLRVMVLGGLQEIGKNMTVIEYKSDIVVIDCGVAFPDDDLLGVDLVIPDTTYLEKNADRVRGILITHGHEDHIGSLPYVLQKLRVPVYGTRLTMGIIKNKLKEANLGYNPSLFTVEAGDTVKLGCFGCEFVHVNHSIADACAIAVTTPVGVVFHTGDFKLDVSPIDGQIMDLTRLGQIGRAGVLLMMGESTNAERAGFTPSERTVGSSLDQIFMTYRDKRIVIATFSSNVHRVQQVIDASAKWGRKVAILGRSMVNVIGAALELGYMDQPEGTLIDVSDIKRYRPDQLTLITTGSQGEPMSALYRMAFGEHDKVKLSSSDLVVLSASAIPGNEKLVDKIINALVKYGIKVVSDKVSDVHVSGHACQEELKLMHALIRPRFFMPIHGENRHLYAHKEIAEFMGMPSECIFLPELGRVLELTPTTAKWNGTVPSGRVLIDGTGVGDVGNVVLRDRKLLSEEGLIAVVAAIDSRTGDLMGPPDILSRGYVYVKDAADLMEEAKAAAAESIDRATRRRATDVAAIKSSLKEDMARFFYKVNKRNPVILPIIISV